MAVRRSTRHASKTLVSYEEPPDLHLPAKRMKTKHGKSLSNDVYPVEVTTSNFFYRDL